MREISLLWKLVADFSRRLNSLDLLFFLRNPPHLKRCFRLSELIFLIFTLFLVSFGVFIQLDSRVIEVFKFDIIISHLVFLRPSQSQTRSLISLRILESREIIALG